jgi:hypothetical protein
MKDCNHHWVTKFGVTECQECGIEYDNCLDAHVTREQQIEYRIEYISTLYKQNLNGRESEDEIFKEGIRAGIEETEEIMYSEEDMVEFANKMQIVSDVDFDGNIKFAFNPSEAIKQFTNK